LISKDVNSNPANGANPALSSDGRYLTFASSTANVAENNPANIVNIFTIDMCNGASISCVPQTFLNSESSAGEIANERSDPSVVSTGGRYVAFQSWSTNLVPHDTDTWSDIFVRDTCIGAPTGCEPTTTIESLGLDGAYGNEGLDGTVVPSISNDGRYVAFASDSTNMAAGMTTDACGFSGNVLVRDTCNGVTKSCTPATSWVSIPDDGSLPNCGSNNQSMSADGRYVAFSSSATNLVIGDTYMAGNFWDIFVRDTCVGALTGCTPSTVRVSVANMPPYVAESNGIADYPQISADGHYVVFMSEAFNLTNPFSNGNEMVYLAKTGY
jgi:Tol biopolymer transport system component